MSRRILCAALAAMMIISMFGCGKGSEQKVTVWLLRPTAAAEPMGTVEVSVKKGTTPAETAMRALIKPPENSDDLESPYIPGVELVGVTLEGVMATVELNERYLDMEGVALVEAESCATLTLCGIDGISGVKFVVNGESHPSGSKLVMTASQIVYDEIGTASVEREVTLYFRSDISGRLEPELRGIALREGEAVEGYVVAELIKGPTQDGLKSVLPDGIELIGIAVGDGVCSLNFSGKFGELTSGPVADEVAALMAIANSIIVSTASGSVRFLVEGEPMFGNATLGENYGLVDPRGYSEYTVYLPSNTDGFVEPVSVRIANDVSMSEDRRLVEWLIGGVDGSGFLSPLPRGTKINAMEGSNHRCTIDFSSEFVDNTSNVADIDAALMSIAQTLTRNGWARNGFDVSVDGKFYATVTAKAEDIHPDFR